MGDIPKPLHGLVTTADMIEALTQANTAKRSHEHQHLFREALRSLVRLAKAEKMWEIKRDIALSVGRSQQGPRPPFTE